MIKKCKCCNKSNLGAVVTVVQTAAVRILGGQITEQFKGSETEETKVEINFCFECNKPVTENDLYEKIECPICGNMVDSLTGNGSCQECSDEADKLLSMSKEQLILMLMKQSKHSAKEEVKKETAKLEVKKENPNKLTETEVIADKLEVKKEVTVSNDKVEVEDKESDEKSARKTKKRKEKEEPVNPSVEEVEEAKEEIEAKIESIATDVAGKVPSTDEKSVQDSSLNVNLDQSESAVPIEDIDIDVDNLLNELDNIDLDSEIF